MGFSPRRAAAGGETVGGKFFKGGQFIGAEFLAAEAGLDRASVQRGMKAVANAVDRGALKSLSHAIARIAKDMKQSFEKAPQGEPSSPGSPPHTHKGVFMRRAVRFAADKTSAIAGTRASVVGDVGATHEFGEERGGFDFPERPFAYPALEKNIGQFASEWSGSIGN